MVDIKWIYDLPKIGPVLRARKYKGFFNFKSGEVAVDLGANVGKITKRMLSSGAHIVYAFEPDPRAFYKLQNDFKDVKNVRLLSAAVSDHSGKQKIYFHQRYKEDPVKWSVASSLFADKGNVDRNNFVEVEVIDIADFISQIREPIGLIKMDIEGEEVRVLNRLIDTGLYTRARNIVVETHERLPMLKIPIKELKKKIKEKKIKNIDLNWA